MKNKIFLFVSVILFLSFSVSVLADELENYMKNLHDSVRNTINTDTLTNDEILNLYQQAITSNISSITAIIDTGSRISDEQFGLLSSMGGVIDTVCLQLSCNNGYNNSSVKIIWRDGLPREGSYTNCFGNISTVSYFSGLNPPASDLETQLPIITDTSFSYANAGNCKLRIVDVITGAFQDISIPVATPFRTRNVTLSGNPPISVVHNEFRLVDYKSIPLTMLSGSYFLAVLNSNNEVIYVKTYKKV